MIFSELYGAYYNTVAEILKSAVLGELTEETLRVIVGKKAFGESGSVIPRAVRREWRLVAEDMKTPLKHIPTMPLTILEKRWLKAVSLDKRIRLFDADFSWLEGTEPLFKPEDVVAFDRYGDGDPYEDEGYIFRFRFILNAIREKRPLSVTASNRYGKEVRANVVPLKLEYSEKDDKFRLISGGCRYAGVLNLARILDVRPYGGQLLLRAEKPERERQVIFELKDERNALERCLMHFAHFRKEAGKTGENTYRIKVIYEESDETELVIRILSFGPMIKVTSPETFVELIRARLLKQKQYRI